MGPILLVSWIRDLGKASTWDTVTRTVNDGPSEKLSPLMQNIGAGFDSGNVWIDLRFADADGAPIHLRAQIALPGGDDEIFVNDLQTPKINGGIAIQFPVQIRNFKAKARLSVRFIYHDGVDRIEYRTDRTIAST